MNHVLANCFLHWLIFKIFPPSPHPHPQRLHVPPTLKFESFSTTVNLDKNVLFNEYTCPPPPHPATRSTFWRFCGGNLFQQRQKIIAKKKVRSWNFFLVVEMMKTLLSFCVCILVEEKGMKSPGLCWKIVVFSK